MFTMGIDPAGVTSPPSLAGSVCPRVDTQHTETPTVALGSYFHVTDTTPAELSALLIYLRSIAPRLEVDLELAGHRSPQMNSASTSR